MKEKILKWRFSDKRAFLWATGRAEAAAYKLPGAPVQRESVSYTDGRLTPVTVTSRETEKFHCGACRN